MESEQREVFLPKDLEEATKETHSCNNVTVERSSTTGMKTNCNFSLVWTLNQRGNNVLKDITEGRLGGSVG